jgi:PEP-CTERM motif-containing protein
VALASISFLKVRSANMKKLFVAVFSLASLGFAGAACAVPVVYQFTGVIDSFDLSVPAFTGSVGDTYTGTLTLDTDTAVPAGSTFRSNGMSYDATIGGLNFAFVPGSFNLHHTGHTTPNDLFFLDEVTAGPNPYGLEYVQIELGFGVPLGGPAFSSDLPVADFLGGFLGMLGSTPSSSIQDLRTHITGLTRVPEPSTYLLLGIGLGGLLFLRRRAPR